MSSSAPPLPEDPSSPPSPSSSSPPPSSSSMLASVLGTVLEGTGWLETHYNLDSTPLEAGLLLGLGLFVGLLVSRSWITLVLLFGVPACAIGLLYFLATRSFTSTPLGDPDPFKHDKDKVTNDFNASQSNNSSQPSSSSSRPRYHAPVKLGTLIARRTFEESRSSASGGSTISASIAPFIKARATSASNGGQPILPPEQYYAKLSGDTLYLHKTADFSDNQAIGICLANHEVQLWPKDTPDPELFAKRNAIRIHRPLLSSSNGGGEGTNSSASSSTPSLSETLGDGAGEGSERERRGLLNPTPWFFFVKSNSEMEDWYLALKHAASPQREESPLDLLSPVFSKEDMAQLVETLDTVPDPIHTRWLNGLFGRIFLGVNRTAWLENFITSRIQKKLNRLPLSPKLSPLIVTAVSFSAPPPTFSSPMLKDLTEDGEASMEVKLAYKGGVRISVSTTLTLVVPFSKEPKTWPMGLTIRVKDLEGDLLVMLKKPPSARLWYGFRDMPKVSISVLPEFSTMKIRWGVLLSPIENQLKEIIAESVVLPNMDDIPWFDTTPFTRGGIFADAVKKEKVEGRPGPTPDVPSEVLLETLVEATEGLPTNLRKRNGASTPSSEVADPNVVGLGINRVATAPPDVETSSTKSTSSTSSYRSWLTGSRGRPSADTASLPTVGSSLREDSSAVASSSDSTASTESSTPSTIVGGVVGVELARTNSAPDHVLADPDPSRSPPEPSQKSHMNRTGHQPALSTSSIPTPSSNGSSSNSSSATVNPSTSPTTTMSILNNLRDKKSREEALAKGLKIAKGWQGMKEARSLWNRKVGDSSSSSNTTATSASDRTNHDESWHQRYVAEETSTISDKSDTPSLYAGSLFSRASKADTALTSESGSPPRNTSSDPTLPHPPSPLLGRKRGDSSASSHHSVEHHPHHPAKPKATYFDPYSSAAKPSVSTTTVVSTAKDGDEIASEPPSSTNPVPPPTLRTHTSGSSSLVAVPPPSIPTTQLHVEPAPSLPSSQTSSTTATGTTTPSTRHNSSFSSPSQDDRSPSSGPPVRTQLSRSTMMRVPAIPKDRKAEQMSFGSTPPEEVENALDQHPSRTTRLGSSIYQLVSGAGSKIQGISPSELPSPFHDESTSTPPAAATPLEDPLVVEAQPVSSSTSSSLNANHPPPLPDRPRTPARDIPPSPTQQDRPPAISTSSTSSSTSTSPSATESLLSIVKLDRDRQSTPTLTPQSSVPTSPVSSSFAGTKMAEGFLIPESKQQRPPTLPPRKSFEVPPKSSSVPLSTDHSSNVHAHAKGPPLPPRAAPTPTAVEGEREGESEVEVVKPAMTRSRSDSEEKSQEGLFPLEG